MLLMDFLLQSVSDIDYSITPILNSFSEMRQAWTIVITSCKRVYCFKIALALSQKLNIWKSNKG